MSQQATNLAVSRSRSDPGGKFQLGGPGTSSECQYIKSKGRLSRVGLGEPHRSVSKRGQRQRGERRGRVRPCVSSECVRRPWPHPIGWTRASLAPIADSAALPCHLLFAQPSADGSTSNQARPEGSLNQTGGTLDAQPLYNAPRGMLVHG